MFFNGFSGIGRLTTTNASSWIEADQLKDRIASRTKEFVSKFGPNDRVLICHGGSAEFIVDLLSVWNCGAAAACANPTITENEKSNLIDFIDPVAVINSPDESVIYLKSSDTINSAVHQDLPALYLFTSGTTGTPKAVEHTFRSLIARLALNQTFIEKEYLATTLCPLPTHFGHGLIGNLLTPLLCGSDVILLDDKSPMGLAKLGEIIDKFDIKFLSSVPSFWKIVTKFSKKSQNGSLKRVHVGSAPLSTELWQAIADWAGTDNVYNMYGITETANWIGGISLREGTAVDGRIGSIWGGSALVKDTNTGEISRTGEGELLIQTPSLMTQYYHQEQLTTDVLKEGWFHTGDIGVITNDGDIRITGRQKSEINKAGIKILPEEIDLLLERHEEVQEVCVFGMPDEISGERVAAACVLVEGSELTKSDFEKWMAPLIRKDAIPETWFFLNEIPKTDRGKVNRDNVRQACLNEGA